MRFKQNPGLLLLVPVFLFCGNPRETLAETRRALLVGINTYVPTTPVTPPLAQANRSAEKPAASREAYSNLSGCVNDAEAMREVLMERFQFESSNILVLLDSQAKRADILAEIQKQLIDHAAPGDVCLFFYAGHGSLIRNLKTTKPSGMDSTLVPADSCEGVMDIRDKELARLFTKALDKGVILTAIFDSCHSGSVARGLSSEAASRNLLPDPRTVSDPPDPGKTPEERGALILSAAQDYQAAAEGRDDKATPHGAFTAALLKALSSTPPNAPAEQLFLSAQVMLQAEKSDQVPVLAGTPERRQRPFLGVGTSTASGRMIVAAQSCDLDTAQVTLRAGQAIGLEIGCELQQLPRIGEITNQAGLRIQVTAVDGFAKSTAKVVSGNFKNVRSGDLFEVTRWVYPSAASLRVWIPSSDLTVANLKLLAPEMASLRSSGQIQWVDDPTELTPTHVLSWSASGWTLSGVGGLGKKLRAQDVIQKLAALKDAKPKLFVSLPAPRELARELKFGEGTPNSSITPVTSASDANFYLTGHWMESKIEYSWIRPNSTKDDLQMNPLPIRTDWFEVSDEGNTIASAARGLEDKALRIGRLKAWLTLGAHGSTSYFPYHLALRNTATGQTKKFGDSVVDGESYGLVLLADPNAQLDRVPPQRVYVLAIDSWGKSQLVFPPVSQGNVGNRVPYDPVDQSEHAAPREIPLGNPNDPTLFTVAQPFGIDTYVLLTSAEAIPEPSALESEGVRTRGPGGSNPLQELLENVGARTRAANPKVPTDWSIEKVCIKSLPKPD
jgi:hypothetical protein